MLILSRWSGESIWLIRSDGVKTLVRLMSASNGWAVLEIEGDTQALGRSGVLWVWEGQDRCYIRLNDAGFGRARLAFDCPSHVTILRHELCDEHGEPFHGPSHSAR